MRSRRAHQAAVAAASDGSVLINLVGQLSDGLVAQLGRELGAGAVFVGVALSERDAARVVERLDGAAAEAAAQLLGARARSASRARPGKGTSSRRRR